MNQRASTELNVLISSAGRRVALLRLWRDTLVDLGLSGAVFATDMVPTSSAFQSADRAFVVPKIRSDEFVPAMLELCERERVGVVVPTLDPELAVYARHRDKFAAIGTTVLISSPEVVAIATDKVATHEFLSRAGLPTVRQGSPEEVLTTPQDWPWPLIAKPRRGSGSIGLQQVATPAALQLAASEGDYIVQTIAAGQEYTISLLASREGRPLCAVPRQRLQTRAGEVSKGLTVRSPVLQELAFRLCEALPGPYAAMNVQVFWDRTTDALAVIELNARFGGGYPLAWQAGAHYPRWILEELLGRTSTASANEWTDGLMMLRWDDAVFVKAQEVGLKDLGAGP